MFNEIWKKMKVLAKVIFWVIAVLSVASGIILFAAGGAEGIVSGIITIVGGIIMAWLSAFGLYAFGELLEKVVEMNENIKTLNKQNVATPPTINQPTPEPPKAEE